MESVECFNYLVTDRKKKKMNPSRKRQVLAS